MREKPDFDIRGLSLRLRSRFSWRFDEQVTLRPARARSAAWAASGEVAIDSRRCMMCTLPSEGVSFCLSAAAKSLLNKKADVKVRELVPWSLICEPFSFFFSPLSVFALGCMSTTLKSFCVPHYFHPSKNTSAKEFDEIIADLVKSFSLLLRFYLASEGQWRCPPLPFLSFFCDFSSLLLSVTGASQIIFFHLFVLFTT